LFYARADELQHDFAPERIGVMVEFPAPASFQLSFNPGYCKGRREFASPPAAYNAKPICLRKISAVHRLRAGIQARQPCPPTCSDAQAGQSPAESTIGARFLNM